jgi:uncharacterized protein YkwD
LAFNSDTFDQQILNLVNEERAKVGADPLQIDQQLDLAADLHSQDQAGMNQMTHAGSNGSDIGTRANDVGYDFSTLGENVAAGYLDAESVMSGWMGSSGHRENILNADFKEIGIGYETGSDGTPYWTQDFGTSADSIM